MRKRMAARADAGVLLEPVLIKEHEKTNESEQLAGYSSFLFFLGPRILTQRLILLKTVTFLTAGMLIHSLLPG